jgi:PAS domain S-box-containing protein
MDDEAIFAPADESGTDSSKANSKAWGDDFHYRALFEHSDDCIFIINFDLHYMAANPQALNLLGYSENELVGKPMSEIVSPDEMLNREAALDNNPNLLERILRRKDGSAVPVEISTSIVYDETGRPVCIQSIARDISRRKEVERALQRHNQIMLSISDATTRLLQSTKIEHKIAEVLESLGRAAGAVACFIVEINAIKGSNSIQIRSEWQKDRIFRLDVAQLIAPFEAAILNQRAGIFADDMDMPPAQSAAIVQIVGEAAQDSRVFLGLFYPEKVQAWLPAQQEAVQIAANIIGAALQRNQHEEAILISEARNRSIIEALPDLIIRMDTNGKILDYSARPDHPLYRPPVAVAGKLLAEIWPEEIASQIMGGHENGAFSEPHHLKEFKLPFSAQTYEARLSPIAAHEALLVVRDITEQAALNQMKSDFINRASHELRTPLATVILMSNLIQEGGTAEELREYWSVLTSELNRQKILIERLLIAGRLESGTMKLESEHIDLVATLEESILAVKPIANKKKIAIQLSTPEKPIPVLGDKSALQQVFINLINNATKFSPEGTSVEVNVMLTGESAQTAITDHGMGIPPEDLPHLCERFFRGKNVTIAEIPGSGIGLYIVKSIIEELGGSLKVESVLKYGTTITVAVKRPKSLPELALLAGSTRSPNT